jgi:8-oxo-dGTP diphosphatase
MSTPRAQLIPAVHLFLIQNWKILLLRRRNTGYEDGNYSVPAGHVEATETVSQAMIRETAEETGLTLGWADLKLVHVMHRLAEDGSNRVNFFFAAQTWQGQPSIKEPDKCDELAWYDLDSLPTNVIPYVRHAIEQHQKRNIYSEFGW